MSTSHRLGDEEAAHLAGRRGRHRRGEEEPDMGAVSGAGALDNRSQASGACGVAKGGDIFLPGGLVEVRGQEPARLILEKRIYPDDVAPAEMIFDDLVPSRDEGLVRALSTLHARLLANPLHPFIETGGRIALGALSRVLP